MADMAEIVALEAVAQGAALEVVRVDQEVVDMAAEAADMAVDTVEIDLNWPQWVDRRLIHLEASLEVIA